MGSPKAESAEAREMPSDSELKQRIHKKGSSAEFVRPQEPGTPSTTDAESNDGSDGHDNRNWRDDAPEEFSWSKSAEPHVARRRAILEKHPEIRELFKPDPWGAVFCLGTVAVQLVMGYLVHLYQPGWPVLIAISWVISGTMNHSLTLAMHELSHDLWFEKRWMNVWFGMIINCPNAIAYSQSFKRYHLEHHTYQGSDKFDADLPTAFEGKLFRYTITKFLWVALQPVFYALRPLIVKPKAISTYEIINWAIVLVFDVLVLKYWGVKSLLYYLLGDLLGLGLHPLAGHFLAEHFEFVSGQETYSMYGKWGNFWTYNVGYHNEHHDFPRVPGRLLPKVREICKSSPEFYENLPHYDSWIKVLIGFIFFPNMNCFCRIKRTP